MLGGTGTPHLTHLVIMVVVIVVVMMLIRVMMIRMIVVVMMLIRVMMVMAIEGNEKPSLHGDDLQREELSAPRPLCGPDTRDDGPNGSYDDTFLLATFFRD